MRKITQRDIARAIGKTDGSITYMRLNNDDMYKLLRLGYMVKREGYTLESIAKLIEKDKKNKELEETAGLAMGSSMGQGE